MLDVFDHNIHPPDFGNAGPDRSSYNLGVESLREILMASFSKRRYKFCPRRIDLAVEEEGDDTTVLQVKRTRIRYDGHDCDLLIFHD